MKVKCLNGEPHFGSNYHCTEQNSSQIHGVCPGGGELGRWGGGLGRGMSISGIDWYITPYVSGILVHGRIPSLY